MSETEAECGCKFHIDYAPCEHHSETVGAGDEWPHLTIEFRHKHSDWPSNRHKVDLERVQRIEMGLDNEPMVFDENSLADMLQGIADANPIGAPAFVLAALANALKGKDEYHRLRLQQAKRGKWSSPADQNARHRQHCAWILRLHRLQKEGWQTDAAIHRIAETTGNSVSRVYAGIAEERAWQDVLTNMPLFHSKASKLNVLPDKGSPSDKI